MFRFVTSALLVAALLEVAPICRAETFTFTYSDPYGDQAHGVLTTAGPDGFGDSGLWVASGSLTITANPQTLPPGNQSSQFPADHYVGTYDLDPIGPAVQTVAGGVASGDNVLYPDQNANSAQPGIGVGGKSYLDGGGLVFGQGPIFINIYAVGDGVYGFQIVNKNSQGHYYTDLGAWAPEAGSMTLTAVPEPSGIVLAGSGAVIAVLVARSRRAAMRGR
jgi:hypothetical protein